jgi:hypothetical protein
MPGNQPAAAEDKPKRRKCGNHHLAKKKLLDSECEENKKRNQSAAIATNLRAQAHSMRMKTIATSLESKADNLLERSIDVKVGTMMATFDIPNKPGNVAGTCCLASLDTSLACLLDEQSTSVTSEKN